ncbi:MAG TPA: glycosyltransferase [Vicinamibacterales bacterium]|nr:glycosyltransferase [Vicinamibacterales bacterium]
MIAPFPRRFVFLGWSITAVWGNTHAPVYRTLLRALVARGHHVLFLERLSEQFGAVRDLPSGCGEVQFYSSVEDLRARFTRDVRTAHCVVVGSSIADADPIANWVLDTARGVRAFYDFDPTATLAAIETSAVPEFDLYLSLAGGSMLTLMSGLLSNTYARPLHCSFDPAWHTPMDATKQWELGYVASDTPEERPMMDHYLLEVARRMPRARFVVAGSICDDNRQWPSNVRRIAPVMTTQQRGFYAQQRFALNLTPGTSPHCRLFQAAACGTPIITDRWLGLDQFFEPDAEVLVADSPDDVVRHLSEIPDQVLKTLAGRARRRLLRSHTPSHRARALERYVEEVARTEQYYAC